MTDSLKPKRQYPAPALNRTIGDVLRGARKGAGLTQIEVADRLRKTQSTVSAWERGQSTPPVDTFIELCGVVGLTVEEAVAGILEMADA